MSSQYDNITTCRHQIKCNDDLLGTTMWCRQESCPLTKKVSGRQIRERNCYKDYKSDGHDGGLDGGHDGGHDEDVDDDGGHDQDVDDDDGYSRNLPIESELGDVLAIEDQS